MKAGLQQKIQRKKIRNRTRMGKLIKYWKIYMKATNMHRRIRAARRILWKKVILADYIAQEDPFQWYEQPNPVIYVDDKEYRM